MTDKATKYLYDIQYAINLIENFLDGIDKFSTYQLDSKTQSAVERQLGIIGEAVNKYRQEESIVNLSNARHIVNFRNRIIHSYDTIDNSIVWSILKNYLPDLKKEIEDLIN